MTDLQQPAPGGHDQPHEATPSFGLRAISLSTAIIKALADEAAPHDLQPVEFNLLQYCAETGESTATQLARVLPIDASRISRIVTRLVDKGLLIRRRLPHDRRTVMLSLTDEGTRLVAELGERVESYLLRLLEGYDEQDLRMVESITVQMRANFAAMIESE
ncbi:MAG: MarR family transcriptional regulator [Gammaproteobacteria bacterium]|nr:MarR family transcriptional regulator [Gammaproteobacteria bacterium]